MLQHRSLAKADPRIFVEAQGLRLWDIHGKEYLDANSGNCWVVNVGYGRKRIVDAVSEQMQRMHYFVSSSGSVPAALFSEALIDVMPGMSRVYHCSSGSEAIEKAFKMVRQISHKQHGGRKYKILFRDRDYHGSTISALSASGQPERHLQYGPLTPGFVQVPHCFEYRAQVETDAYGEWAAEQIEKVILREGPDTVGALCLEPITAGGGVIPPPSGYWESVGDICRKHEILLIIDEVVCGAGRTGQWFGYQHYGVEPDFVTMAKGLASGYAAIACLVTSEKVFDMFRSDPNDPLDHFRDISSYGGCAAGPVAALENLGIIRDEALLENCTAMGERLLAGLAALKDRHRVIGDVRGKGLFTGIELVSDRSTKEPAPESMVRHVVNRCAEMGVIIGVMNRSMPGANNVLVTAPALTATESDIDAIVATVDTALGTVFPS
ncbi:aminotransferase class III-fold pyridoxal phosphate-dependent enzyme [Roseibacterium sp. SDUM158016]|uniref:aminotransferase family protein n=1 Tax=Roseicyclus sediminis TaxID=2980997 RepID=UPI0021CF5540|nr:aminotransferase class III-fold pyridoxal phosphate-dependent enzyme [Roseibacterium sp. SDUM158016]MCU4652642.1 aminotransferase class III-fold pyridoxal phosphate-dependent enzyme [Roseibacterium sp. SDUM158016]